jgi:hypothetical protein
MSDHLTIGDILARSLTIEWFEGVAIVRDVADRIADTAALRGGVPDLDEIRLTRDGRAEVVSAARSDEPVRRIAQLLQALVAQSDAPVQLRLLISQATAPEPEIKSIREFAEALAYYERPQRAAILSRLYGRAAAADVAAQADKFTLDTLAPLPAAKSEAAAKPLRSLGRFWKFAAAAGLLIALGAAAAHYARTNGFVRGARARFGVAAARASDRVGNAVLSGASNVTDKIGLGRLVPGDQPPSPPAPPPPSPPAPRPKHVSSALHSQPVRFVAFDLEPVREISAGLAKASTAAPDTALAAASLEHTEAAAPDLTTYGPDSEDVTPPVAVRPRLPRQLPPSVNNGDLSRIELLVGFDGTVESVKLRGRNARVPQRMFLSAAKAWQFEPALKNGRPVKYRKTIWILDQ